MDELILCSCLPVANIEKIGAADSTGFSTRKYDSWQGYKWGSHDGKERNWVKLHAFSCCRSNAFISVKITEKNVADIKMLESVVSNKTKFFDLENFVADKAYNSRKVFDFIGSLGLGIYIPFKKNVRGRSMGSRVWREFFLHFHHSRDHFMEEYHQRSNIETSFHMLKQRFGHFLQSKNLVANRVELMVMVLCHNICVLIAEAFETGIKIDLDKIAKKVKGG